jgi:hypothetical protein
MSEDPEFVNRFLRMNRNTGTSLNKDDQGSGSQSQERNDMGAKLW